MSKPPGIPQSSGAGGRAVSPASAPVSRTSKSIHTIILDSSPLLLNIPPISTLLSTCEQLVTTESVLSEIRDKSARARVETIYRPFLSIRAPRSSSVVAIKEFARRTGDAASLSRIDLEVIALAYDLECERNGGDWRLRRIPGQKELNGPKPTAVNSPWQHDMLSDNRSAESDSAPQITDELRDMTTVDQSNETTLYPGSDEVEALENTQRNTLPAPTANFEQSSDSDSEGWITPSNVKKHQEKDSRAPHHAKASEARVLQVATMTGDFAMQNVLLQMNLNLLSPKDCKRITQLKQTILRCHGCFSTTRDMSKQFCPRCGQATLTRVTCTTTSKGEVRLHLKTKIQWNNKGNVYSVPKPVSGRSNQKWTSARDGGGKGGWGRNLLLAEDQKEYVRAITPSNKRRGKEENFLEQDALPNILTGERTQQTGRIRVGVERNVNARKR